MNISRFQRYFQGSKILFFPTHKLTRSLQVLIVIDHILPGRSRGFFFLNAVTLCMCLFSAAVGKINACWVLISKVASVSNMEQGTSGAWDSNLAGQLLFKSGQLLP